MNFNILDMVQKTRSLTGISAATWFIRINHSCQDQFEAAKAAHIGTISQRFFVARRDAKGWPTKPSTSREKTQTRSETCGLCNGVLACQEYQAWYVMVWYVLAGQYKNSVFSVHCVASLSGSHQMAFSQSQHARHASEHRHKVQGLCISHHEISQTTTSIYPYQS